MNPFLALSTKPDDEKSAMASLLAMTAVGNRASAYDLIHHEGEAAIYTLGELKQAASVIGQRLIHPGIEVSSIQRTQASKNWEEDFVNGQRSLDEVPFGLLVNSLEEAAVEGWVIKLDPLPYLHKKPR